MDQHDALCLRSREVGEHDLIVTYLTHDAGKLAVMARGVKRAKSRNAPLCGMFTRCKLRLAAGRGLPVLAQGELLESHYALREDLWRAAYATYLCELTDRALPDAEPQPGVFELLLWSLTGLTLAPDGAALVHSYELRLLTALGYQPVLDGCARTGVEFTGEVAWFSPAAGGLIHPDALEPGEVAVEVTPKVVRAMRRLLDPVGYEVDLLQLTIPPDLLPTIRAANRAQVRYYLETEPKSAEFLDQLRAMDEAP